MKSNFTAIHHVSVIVADINRSLYFYHEVLGLPIDPARPEMTFPGAWLKVNQIQQIHLLQLDNPDSVERPAHGGRDRHAAFQVEDLGLIENALENAGIEFSRSHSGRAAIFCRDPDGNTLELLST